MTKEELDQLQAAAQEKMQEVAESMKKDFANKGEIEAAVKVAKEELKADLEKAQTAEQVNKLVEEKAAELQKKIDELNVIVEKQGEMLNKTQVESNRVNIFKTFVEKYKALRNGDKDTNASNTFVVSEKDWNSEDTITVNDVPSNVYPSAGTTGIIGTLGAYFAQVIGFFTKPRPKSQIMNWVDIIPLEGNQLVAFVDDVIGEAEFTPECALKPIITPSLEAVTSNAGKVAVFWKTSWEFRKFFNAVAQRFRVKAEELVMDAIPSAVITEITNNAAAFTPNAAFAINSDPNNYDALGAVIASLENLGYTPNGILVNPIAWRNMKQMKSELDDHYMLSNGQSISILDDGIDWGGYRIPIVKDPTLGVDEFIVGDFFNSVKVGLDAGVEYRENVNNEDDFRRNLLAHVLEKAVAIIIPLGSESGIVFDTFSNVKTLITAEEPS